MSTSAQESAPTPAEGRHYRVLLVEDAPDTRELLRLLFEGEGYEVVMAADGLAAVEAALRERPDAIVMDMSLPRLDGYNATKLIRREPVLRGIPVIACTALNRWEWRGKAIAAGCDAFLTKPIDFRLLTETLDGLIARARRRQSGE